MSGAAAHPWLSALFGDPELAEILSAEATLARMLRVEAAWTRTIAPAPEAERIAARIEHAPIRPSDLAEGTARDGLPVPALAEALRQTVPEADRRWVHRGLTSQDVMDTALVMALQEIFPRLADRLDSLIAALEHLFDRDGHRPLMGMTRMQPALPIRAGDRIRSWSRPLEALAKELPPLADRCAILQWGGPVGRRDPDLPTDTGDRFAAALTLRDPGHAWHSDRSMLAEVAGFLSRIAGATGKIGQDIALAAQTAPGAMVLTRGGGSSAMPHKSNPILAELLVTLARRNAGDLSSMHHALIHEQERSGAAWALEWLVLPQMIETTGRSLLSAVQLIERVERMGEADGTGPA